MNFLIKTILKFGSEEERRKPKKKKINKNSLFEWCVYMERIKKTKSCTCFPDYNCSYHLKRFCKCSVLLCFTTFFFFFLQLNKDWDTRIAGRFFCFSDAGTFNPFFFFYIFVPPLYLLVVLFLLFFFFFASSKTLFFIICRL